MINRLTRYWYNKSLGLLIIRVATGLVFLMHGWMKVESIGMIEGFFSHLGLPAWVAVFIAGLEVAGGLALILGVATRVFGALFAIEMLVAVLLTGANGAGFGYHSHELEIFLGLVSLGIVAAGSGRFSVFRLECDNCGGMLCDGGERCPKRA